MVNNYVGTVFGQSAKLMFERDEELNGHPSYLSVSERARRLKVLGLTSEVLETIYEETKNNKLGLLQKLD